MEAFYTALEASALITVLILPWFATGKKKRVAQPVPGNFSVNEEGYLEHAHSATGGEPAH